MAVWEGTLLSLCLSYKILHKKATVTVLTVLAVSAVMAVSVMTASPLKLNSRFADHLIILVEFQFLRVSSVSVYVMPIPISDLRERIC